jgi:hypothetical protein
LDNSDPEEESNLRGSDEQELRKIGNSLSEADGVGEVLVDFRDEFAELFESDN